MKKEAIFSVALILSSCLMNTIQAQFANYILKSEPLSTVSFNTVPTIHSKAETNFSKAYENATEVKWSILNHRRSTVHFLDNGIQTKIFFGRKGNQEGMIRYYTEDQIPAEVKNLVRSFYYDFTIFLAMDVTYGNQNAYLVKIKNTATTKTIKVMDREMEVVDELKNL